MNQINETYIAWLKEFNAKDKNPAASRITQQLIPALQRVSSVEELLEIIEHHLKDNNFNNENIQPYLPISFYNQLSSWKNHLVKLLESQKRVSQALITIDKNATHLQCMFFMESIINNPLSLLNVRINSLHQILLDQEFIQIMGYIASRAEAPAVTNPKKGSFAAIEPVDQNHAEAIKLLNNLMVSYEDGNPLWEKGNSLLQTSLAVFQDLQMEDIDLTDSDNEENNNQCNLM